MSGMLRVQGVNNVICHFLVIYPTIQSVNFRKIGIFKRKETLLFFISRGCVTKIDLYVHENYKVPSLQQGVANFHK